MQDLVEQGEIPKELLNKLDLDGNYRFGYYMRRTKNTYNRDSKSITIEEKKKLEKLGIVSLEEKTTVAQFIEIAEKLKNAGIEVGKLPQATTIKENGEKVFYTLQDLVEKGRIPEELLKQLDLDGDYRFGYYTVIAKQTYKGNTKNPITEDEKRKLEELGIITKLNMAKQQRDAAKQKNTQAKELEKQALEQLKKRGKSHEGK